MRLLHHAKYCRTNTSGGSELDAESSREPRPATSMLGGSRSPAGTLRTAAHFLRSILNSRYPLMPRFQWTLPPCLPLRTRGDHIWRKTTILRFMPLLGYTWEESCKRIGYRGLETMTHWATLACLGAVADWRFEPMIGSSWTAPPNNLP